MANYIAIHTASSLIVNIIAASEQPAQSSACRFIRVSDAVLNKYYRLASKNRNGTLVSAGQLAAISPAFLSSLAVR
jgi:hypothetical protein